MLMTSGYGSLDKPEEMAATEYFVKIEIHVLSQITDFIADVLVLGVTILSEGIYYCSGFVSFTLYEELVTVGMIDYLFKLI